MEAKDMTFRQMVWLLNDDSIFDNQNGTNRKIDEGVGRQELGLEVELYVKYKPSASIFFRLRASFVQSGYRDVVAYSDITPDRFSSLKRIIYNSQNEEDHPQYLHTLRKKMGLMGSDIMCLRFGLNRPGDLWMPPDLTYDNLEMKQRHDPNSFFSLATARVFSLYMPPSVLPSADFQKFQIAISQWSQSSPEQKSKLMQMVDHKTLYSGKGGKLFNPSNSVQVTAATAVPFPNSPPPYDAENDRFQSPTESQSDDATVATETPPQYCSPDRIDCEPQNQPQLEDIPGDCVPSAYNTAVVSYTRTTEIDRKRKNPDPEGGCLTAERHPKHKRRAEVLADNPPNQATQIDDAQSSPLATDQQTYEYVTSHVPELGKRRRPSREWHDSHPRRKADVQSFSNDDASPESCEKLKPPNGSLMDTVEACINCKRNYSRIDRLEHLLMTSIVRIKQLEAKDEELAARVFQQQSEMRSLMGPANKLQNQDNQLIYLDTLAERQDELERRQDEYEDSQVMLEKRHDILEETMEEIDVRITELSGSLDDDWKLQLADEMKSESVAGVKEFLRNI